MLFSQRLLAMASISPYLAERGSHSRCATVTILDEGSM